jgi:Fe-S-cluster containining protein
VIGDQEIADMARLLGVSEWEFVQNFTRLRPRRDGLSLLDKENGECVFLDGGDCRVQAAKPIQCRGFPNLWNFPGWRSVCDAVPRLVKAQPDPSKSDARFREVHA